MSLCAAHVRASNGQRDTLSAADFWRELSIDPAARRARRAPAQALLPRPGEANINIIIGWPHRRAPAFDLKRNRRRPPVTPIVATNGGRQPQVVCAGPSGSRCDRALARAMHWIKRRIGARRTPGRRTTATLDARPRIAVDGSIVPRGARSAGPVFGKTWLATSWE